LIEPTGPGPYLELLDKDLIGLNHLALTVKDFDPVIERLSKINVKTKGEPVSGPRGMIWDLEQRTTAGMRIQMFRPTKE
jgi:hypothetical protein